MESLLSSNGAGKRPHTQFPLCYQMVDANSKADGEPESTLSSSGSGTGFTRRLHESIGNAESATSFAKRAGVSQSGLSRLLHGGDPTLPVLVSIARAANVRLEWLATGEGPMRVGEAQRGGGNALERLHVDELGEDYILLPRYDVRAAAGAGAVIHSEQIVDYLSFKAEWIRHRLRRNPQYLLLIEAMGDSMEPLIADGDLLLLDTQIDHVRDNAIYALNIAGSLLVKRIIRRFDGGITIASDNARYPAETLSATDAERIHVVGQVVWHAGVL